MNLRPDRKLKIVDGPLSRQPMERGDIQLDVFDLQSTVESGQSYTWAREDGLMYEDAIAYGGDAWYYTVLSPDALPPGISAEEPVVVRVRQQSGRLVWESNIDAHGLLVRLLGLDEDLDSIIAEFPDDPLVQDAYNAYRGMRLVRDPFFSSLISFICSAQMRVSRIHDMQQRLAREFGETVRFDGGTYHAFPTPDQLAGTSESELRDLKLGYRAPYVQETAEMIASGDSAGETAGLPYEEARESLTRFVGCGEKVADCVLLFSLGYLQAVPLDTWIRGAIEEHYPDCQRDNYTETSRAIRERLGGTYAGYVQTYVFHYLRAAESE